MLICRIFPSNFFTRARSDSISSFECKAHVQWLISRGFVARAAVPIHPGITSPFINGQRWQRLGHLCAMLPSSATPVGFVLPHWLHTSRSSNSDYCVDSNLNLRLRLLKFYPLKDSPSPTSPCRKSSHLYCLSSIGIRKPREPEAFLLQILDSRKANAATCFPVKRLLSKHPARHRARLPALGRTHRTPRYSAR